MSAHPTPDRAPRTPMAREDIQLVFASSFGTVYEWYDFYLYGALAPIIAAQFFSGLDPSAGFIFALLAFAAGFIVRPFGALVFGRLGDMIGRKYTFLITILLMGLSTCVVGVLPSYADIGLAAPVMLIALRLLQGLAMGGEYGGAATYVAEHAPPDRRGFYTSWIQTTASLGLFMALVVILLLRQVLGDAAFADWGWRIPFLLSIVLLAVSVWVRLSMNESPAFQRLRETGRTSKAPIRESFGNWRNLRVVLLALFGLVAGQAVVWYTGQFYALFFLTGVLRVEPSTAQWLMVAALAIGTPFFVFFGALADRIGRKPIIMAGLALAAAGYFPMFEALTVAANPALAEAQANARIVVAADPATCSFQGSPIAREVDFASPCDLAKRFLTEQGASYDNRALPRGAATVVRVGSTEITPPRGGLAAGGHGFDDRSVRAIAAFRAEVRQALLAAGYPERADPARMDKVGIVVILSAFMLLVTMVYGPIAAMLVEMFPTRIRYTSMSLPYHIGNGWFGGLMPSIAFAIVAHSGNMYDGLWYPVLIAAGSCAIGLLLVRETRGRDIYAQD
ncbi:major facilitator superfamily MFS_1 [Leptothrix cholodnii SP-6]|uniref:Major facilitator superfamily MFS_1 n=1 Tax=Leptothrix cholodnii (strain ATCC 51168 / LMG 8142 / SP-6) TaxID=395495 RepID=B1Y7R7_LEPCP|nr:MFS transporter [Leptothrix cholodnii]ACB32515.1 major facilitator superfamily MFS_1 [Leptothrix cholodnii SP-6]